MLRVRDVGRILEAWAPRTLAWERDNVGLQIGDPDAAVRRILVALDATGTVAAEAVRRHTDLIVTHHPPLYRPLRSLDTSTAAGRMIAALVKHDCALYAAHTNLDAARGGTSHVLAETLGLRDIRPLAPRAGAMRKVITFAPPAAVETIAAAMVAAGAGTIGKYDACSFRTRGTGTFRGNAGTSPAVGRRERLEQVEEIRLEMVTEDDRLPAVLAALRKTHPYEEVAFDVMAVEGVRPATGMGATGTSTPALPAASFLRHVRKHLRADGMRHTRPVARTIRTVAVCGGAGSDLIGAAIAAGADAFVTADVSYHAFQEAEGRILLIDAGHYETEVPVVGAVVRHLRTALQDVRPAVTVTPSALRTSPIVFM